MTMQFSKVIVKLVFVPVLFNALPMTFHLT